MAKKPVKENGNQHKATNSVAIRSSNQAKRKSKSRTMNGHVKNEEAEVLAVPSSSTETESGDAGESNVEVEEGGENRRIRSVKDEEEVIGKIKSHMRKGQKDGVENQGRRKRKKVEVEEEENVETALYKFPMNRVSRIIRSEIANVRLSQEAVFVINRAAEKFIELFSREAYACAFLDRKKHVAYHHLSSVVSKRKRFGFVSDIIPEKVKAEVALAQITESEK